MKSATELHLICTELLLPFWYRILNLSLSSRPLELGLARLGLDIRVRRAQAAINADGLAVDVRRVVGREPERSLGDLCE